MINVGVFQGRVVDDPRTGSDPAVPWAAFTLAQGGPTKAERERGEKGKRAIFIDCITFVERTVEFARALKRGDTITVEYGLMLQEGKEKKEGGKWPDKLQMNVTKIHINFRAPKGRDEISPVPAKPELSVEDSDIPF